MAAVEGGIGILGVVAPVDQADFYPVIDPLYGIDGLRSVATISERNAISSQRRRHGMLAFVRSDNQYYRLEADLVTWSIWESGGGGVTPAPTTITVYSEPVLISGSADDNYVPQFVTMPDGDTVNVGVY